MYLQPFPESKKFFRHLRREGDSVEAFTRDQLLARKRHAAARKKEVEKIQRSQIN